MSQAAPARFLANDAYVTALAYANGVAAFALGDGTVKLVADDGGEIVAAAHDGAALCLAAYGDGFVSGGDDGRLVTIARDGAVTELLKLRGKMIEHVAVSAQSGALVAAAGRDIHIIAKPSRCRTRRPSPDLPSIRRASASPVPTITASACGGLHPRPRRCSTGRARISACGGIRTAISS